MASTGAGGEWRAAKEAFVTGLGGTALGEVALLGVLPPAGAALAALARRAAGVSWAWGGAEGGERVLVGGARGRQHRGRSGARAFGAAATAFCLDFVALPGLFTAVLLRLCPLPAALAACAAACACLSWLAPAPRGAAPPPARRGHLRCLGEARGALLLVTAACILAVDFPAFPRRWAKAETFGAGLMDVGVGQFVLYGALTSGLSARRRGAPEGAPLRAAAPLLLLGLGRVAALRSVDYHEHVGEYGVHWNFFLTMAVVAAMGSAFHPPAWLCAAAGGSLLGLHQATLVGGGSRFVMSDDRSGGSSALGRLLVLNKEGICSLPGYVALFLLGRAAAAVLGRVADASGHLTGRALAGTAAAAGAFWGAVMCLEAYIEPVSRRSANAGYVALSLAFGLSSLALHALLGCVHDAPGTAPLLEAFNRRGLSLFLLANVLTGAVNLGFDTLHAGMGSAAGIVGMYLACLCLFAAWPGPGPGGGRAVAGEGGGARGFLGWYGPRGRARGGGSGSVPG